ncbi:hypothetical protein Bacsa_2850 [Phocaeicola salanitronis DSM 18170]|uniref:Uncharacterized protein n=1 Tax=Phocaeicola salanitronis (strain DSM 18170 / JCM 13657 / CCUG 60908 / BL78) TaxID=667015 RepID=F0R1D9_PHOSB|nr:hypothetical protein Bacsa_2850 [Phocaeicola salanitronis DSM 18170]
MSVRPPRVRILTFHLISVPFTPTVPNIAIRFSLFSNLTHSYMPYMKFLSVRLCTYRQLHSDSDILDLGNMISAIKIHWELAPAS